MILRESSTHKCMGLWVHCHYEFIEGKGDLDDLVEVSPSASRPVWPLRKTA